MKTGQEMYDFSAKNGYGSGMLGWGQKSFEVVAKNLMPDEEALICFIGLHYSSPEHHCGNFAYAITNKRLILGQKKVIGETVQFINLDNINDITLSTNAIYGYITFDTYKECFKVGFVNEDARKLYSILNSHFAEFKKINQQNANSKQTDAANEILKFKQLLDNGIITQEEFNAKKKQLLGL